MSEKGMGLKGWLSGPQTKSPRTEQSITLDKHRIAVLPLSNISPDPKDDYFADGISDELISTLSKIQGLRVISRASTTKYKGSGKGAGEIGQELRSGSIVEGTVRKAGNKLRITAQLTDAESEESLWSETYDRDLDDVFQIQTDIARQVGDALKVKLLGPDKSRLERLPTTNQEAYDLYLKGHFYFTRSTHESYKQSIDYFEKAIVLDPKFALAYSGLARAWSALGFQGFMSSRESAAKAKKYVEKSLRLDDTQAEAHRTLGGIYRVHEWNLSEAEREFNRALELNPSLADAYGSRGILHLSKGNFAEAIIDAKRALELDPLSGRTAGFAGTIFLYAGQYEEAIEQFNRALQSDSKDALSQGNIGLAHIQLGQFELGLKELDKVDNIDDTQIQGDIVYAFAKAGQIDRLKNQIGRLLVEEKKNHELAFALASAYVNLGDNDRAIEWLEVAYREHVSALVTAQHNFAFDRIRSDPRFKALMKKLGF